MPEIKFMKTYDIVWTCVVCSSNVVNKMFNMIVEFCRQEVLSKSAPKKNNNQKQHKTTKTTNKSNQYNMYMYIITAKTQPLEYGVGFIHFIFHLNSIY